MKTTVSRQAIIPAWQGAREDLALLVQHLEVALSDQHREAVQGLDRTEAELVADGMSPEQAADRMDLRKRAVSQRFDDVHVIATDRRTSATTVGTLDEVVGGVSVADLESLRIYYPSPSSDNKRSAYLSFTRGLGLLIGVEGDEPVWVHAMLTTIKDEGKRRAPWWAFFFTGWGSVLVYVVMFAILLMAALGFRRQFPQVDISFLVLIAGTSLVSMVLTNGFLLQRLLPRFEILASGAMATGTKRLLAVMGVLMSALVGAFFSFILSSPTSPSTPSSPPAAPSQSPRGD